MQKDFCLFFKAPNPLIQIQLPSVRYICRSVVYRPLNNDGQFILALNMCHSTNILVLDISLGILINSSQLFKYQHMV